MQSIGVLLILGFFSCSADKVQNEVGHAVKSKIEVEEKLDKEMEKATFGAGCFWCVEAIFSELKGFIQLSRVMLVAKVRIQPIKPFVAEQLVMQKWRK